MLKNHLARCFILIIFSGLMLTGEALAKEAVEYKGIDGSDQECDSEDCECTTNEVGACIIKWKNCNPELEEVCVSPCSECKTEDGTTSFQPPGTTGHSLQGGEQVGHPTLDVQWTRWLNRDGPGGTGDFETLRDHRRERPREVCERPSDIECRVKGSSELVETGVLASGERFTCDRTVGAVCDNRKQPPGVRCRDYEVRFACEGTLRQDL